MSGVLKKHLSTPLLVTTCYTPDIPPYIILLGYHYHFYIFLNPLATTLTSLFPFCTPFTYCSTLWLPLIHPFSPTTPLLHIFEPFGYHSYIPFFPYITPLLHIVEPFGYHSYIPFPLLHHKQLNAIVLYFLP